MTTPMRHVAKAITDLHQSIGHILHDKTYFIMNHLKKNICSLILVLLMAATAQAQETEPNVMRYYMKDGSKFDVKINQISGIRRNDDNRIDHIFNNTNTISSIAFDQVDSIAFLYIDFTLQRNINANTRPGAMRMEFPHLRESEDQLLISHETEEYGVTYALEWDCSKKAQRWTCYQFHNGVPNNNIGRKGKWMTDMSIPAPYRTYDKQYKNTGFSRGHMCMSEDRQSSVEQNQQTFYMSNTHPQYQNHNGILWLKLESAVNKWGNDSLFRDTLYVVKAGTIDRPEQLLPPTSTGLLVPKYFYMAVLCVKDGQYKAIGFWTEHTDERIKHTKPADYAISIKELEALTGIDFFCNLPDEIEEKAESSYQLSDWGL